MILSNAQMNEINDLIQVNHLLFIAQNVGVEMLSNVDKSLLSTYGINVDEIEENSTLLDAFTFGLVSSNLTDEQLELLDYDKFKKFAESKEGLKLTDIDKEVFGSIQRQAYKDLKGLGNRISADGTQIFIEADKQKRAEYEKLIKRETEKNFLTKGTVKDLVSSLGHKTKDWARDFGRIADFIHHSAFDEGRALNILKQYGENALVYKSVYEGACKHCRESFLTNPQNINSEPINYKVSELLANGTNIGKKKDDWLPVIGSQHPLCRCMIHRRLQGYKWNESERLYNLPTEYERKVQRNSKARIKVGDQPWKEI